MEIVLFHHVRGLTDGVRAFAEELRQAGHTVHTPDLFDGRTFASIDEGMAFAQALGFPDEVLARAARAVRALPEGLVYAGFSLGVLPAQKLAQTRPGARGALFFYSFVPMNFFGPWPTDLRVQIHAMDADPFFVDEGDINAARELVASSERAELFLYPGNAHLFADSSVADYDPQASALLMQRVLAFLESLAPKR